jgi:hypothetical protein
MATIRAPVDSTQWRLAILAAALESMRREWPHWAKWPVVFGGFSWGAMLAKIASINSCEFLSVRGASAFKKSEKNLASPLNLQ